MATIALPPNTLNAAVIGLGRVGMRWEHEDRLRAKPATHVGAWNMTKGVDVKVLCDSDPQAMEAAKSTMPRGVGYVYTDYLQMLEDFSYKEGLSIVSVATPAATHKDVVCNIAEAKMSMGGASGIKLIFCEKPIAQNLNDAMEMVQACKDAGIILAVNHTRRWDPVYQRMVQTVKSGRYGDVLAIQSAYSGDWLEVGTHMGDLYNWLGIPTPERYPPTQVGVDYLVFEIRVFCKGGTVTVPANGEGCFSYKSVRSNRYEGVYEPAVDGMFSLATPFYLLGNNQRTLTESGSVDTVAGTPLLWACEQLRDCVLGKQEKPLCSGWDGMQALRRTVGWA